MCKCEHSLTVNVISFLLNTVAIGTAVEKKALTT